METIGIIAALAQEREAILRLVKGEERTSLATFRCDRFRLPNWDAWLVTSGMGRERAAQAVRLLAESAHPQFLASVGVAGAVNADLEMGDVVSATRCCLLEEGRISPSLSLAHLSTAASQAIMQSLQARTARLFSGTAVTTGGSQFITNGASRLENPILEMETFGMACIAAGYGIPLLSLRAISDGSRAPIPFDLEAVMDEEYNLRMGAIIKKILVHPQTIPQLLRLGRNTKMAAENAAIALVAALSQPGPVISS